MTVEITLGTPLAAALANVLQPKLVEEGWSSGGHDDSALSEYIILMLVNGKTQEQIASELSNDLLGDESGAAEFAQWLFEQVDRLNAQLNGAHQSTDSVIVAPASAPPDGAQAEIGHDQRVNENAPTADAEMTEVNELSQSSIPTGPKAMRSGNQKSRDKRMLGQLSKAMDRSADAALHRVRGTSGTGRVNSHSGGAPKGPRNQLGRHVPGANNRAPSRYPMSGVGFDGGALPLMNNNMTPQQQMQLFAFYEEQARLMQQLFAGQASDTAFINPNFQNPNQPTGKSLFERVQGPSTRPQGSFGRKKPSGTAQADSTMTDAAGDGELNEHTAHADDASISSSECRYNLSCTKPDCPFAHQSPAAPPGTVIDPTDVCAFGAACKNHKCVGRHPSPAKKASHQAEQECRYWPHCTNPTCAFRHPSMPPCKNGADCTTPDCKFTHLKTMCKFNPCLNPHCPYKHAEGQKRGTFADKVWTAGESKREHVSERKFVNEDVEEELIIPGGDTQDMADIVS